MPAAAAACFLLCAGSAFADNQVIVLAKAGATYDMRAADQDRCSAIVQKAPLSDLPPPDHPMAYPVVYGGGAAGVAGTFFADSLIKEEQIAEARSAGEKVCIHNLGYIDVPLTADEASAYHKGSHEAWERAFMAGDLTARIKAMNIPVVPPLPPYRDDPMSQGGIKIDAASIALATTTNDGEGPVLTGKAVRYRTATLVTPIATTAGDVLLTAPAGTIFHQIDNRSQREPLLRKLSATWCGPVHQTAKGVEAEDFYCFIGRNDGYEIFHPSGQEWYAGPYTDGLLLPRYTQPIRLEERTVADDLGPLDLTVEVDDIHKTWIDFSAYVAKDGKKSKIWWRRVMFNAKGEAVLPLWNQRLQIAHIGEHGSRVKLALTQDGGGQSWRDEDTDPAANP